MDQLSSCYFCGAALDASLDEYPVVPRALQPTPDGQRTVVLCQGCREKLATIVEPVVAAAGDDDGHDGSAGEETPEEWAARAESAATSRRDDAGGTDDQPRTGETPSGSNVDGQAAADGEDVTYTRSTAAGGREAASGEPESLGDPSEDGREAASRNGSETPARGDGEPAAGDDSGSAAGDDSGSAAGEPEAAPDAVDDAPSMSALEYNKVMRLLQNRELPVDRAEIQTVATNAYEISDAEFDAVIDAAIDRGLIAEENGQFVSQT